MTLGPAKHEKGARIGRISNVFRIVGAQSAEQSVGIMGSKYLLPQHHIYTITYFLLHFLGNIKAEKLVYPFIWICFSAFALVCILVYETLMLNIFMVVPKYAKHGSFVITSNYNEKSIAAPFFASSCAVFAKVSSTSFSSSPL